MNWYTRFAHIVSWLSSPMLVVGLFLFYVVYHFAPNFPTGHLWFALSVVLIGVAPSIYILFAVRAGHIKDYRLTQREDRFGPFLIASIGMILTLLIFYKLGTPVELLLFLMSGLLVMLVAMIITLFWKISIHALAITAVVTTINIVSNDAYWYLFLLVPLVMWSRVALKRHTVAQVIAGALLSMVTVYIVFKVYGL